MERVGIRELRNNVAAVVRRAGAGERIVVTVDGVPAAQLGPLEATGGGHGRRPGGRRPGPRRPAGATGPPPPEAEDAPGRHPARQRARRAARELSGPMTLFVDTSALVRRYVQGPDRALVRRRHGRRPRVVRVGAVPLRGAAGAAPPGGHRRPARAHVGAPAGRLGRVRGRCRSTTAAWRTPSSWAPPTGCGRSTPCTSRRPTGCPGPRTYLTYDRRQIPAAAGLGFDVRSPLAGVKRPRQP